MGKEVKTNAMRILDRHKVAYEILNYECDEFIDGLSDLFVVYRVAGAVKAAKQAAEAIDVEVVEEDSEENE